MYYVIFSAEKKIIKFYNQIDKAKIYEQSHRQFHVPMFFSSLARSSYLINFLPSFTFTVVYSNGKTRLISSFHLINEYNFGSFDQDLIVRFHLEISIFWVTFFRAHSNLSIDQMSP